MKWISFQIAHKVRIPKYTGDGTVNIDGVLVVLPKDYLEFVEDTNGVIFTERGVLVQYPSAGSKVDDVAIEEIYGVGPGHYFSLPNCQKNYGFDEWIGLPFICIACGPDYQVCVNLDHGGVFLHALRTDRPNSKDDSATALRQLEMIAPSFSHFICNLYMNRIL